MEVRQKFWMTGKFYVNGVNLYGICLASDGINELPVPLWKSPVHFNKHCIKVFDGMEASRVGLFPGFSTWGCTRMTGGAGQTGTHWRSVVCGFGGVTSLLGGGGLEKIPVGSFVLKSVQSLTRCGTTCGENCERVYTA
jgi:hypothetical protein